MIPSINPWIMPIKRLGIDMIWCFKLMIKLVAWHFEDYRLTVWKWEISSMLLTSLAICVQWYIIWYTFSMCRCNRSTVEMLKYKLIFIQYCHSVVPYTSNHRQKLFISPLTVLKRICQSWDSNTTFSIVNPTLWRRPVWA